MTAGKKVRKGKPCGRVSASARRNTSAAKKTGMSISDRALSLRGARNSDRQLVLRPKLDSAVCRLWGEDAEANNPQTEAS